MNAAKSNRSAVEYRPTEDTSIQNLRYILSEGQQAQIDMIFSYDVSPGFLHSL
jgi:hypothetical protein